jgi:predicted RNase H-like HicB family nuclease
MEGEIDRSELTPEELAAGRCYGMSIDWSAEDEVFLASFPDVPGLVTHGATREAAAAMGDEAIAIWLSVMRGLGQPVPAPTVVDPTEIIKRHPEAVIDSTSLPERETA